MKYAVWQQSADGEVGGIHDLADTQVGACAAQHVGLNETQTILALHIGHEFAQGDARRLTDIGMVPSGQISTCTPQASRLRAAAQMRRADGPAFHDLNAQGDLGVGFDAGTRHLAVALGRVHVSNTQQRPFDLDRQVQRTARPELPDIHVAPDLTRRRSGMQSLLCGRYPDNTGKGGQRNAGQPQKVGSRKIVGVLEAQVPEVGIGFRHLVVEQADPTGATGVPTPRRSFYLLHVDLQDIARLRFLDIDRASQGVPTLASCWGALCVGTRPYDGAQLVGADQRATHDLTRHRAERGVERLKRDRISGRDPQGRRQKARPARPQLVIHHLTQVMNDLQAGERLPSETALSQKLGVSRNTVRDALAALEREGMVTRQHGLGTFKAQRPQTLQASLNRVLPIPDVIRAAGHMPQVKVWSRRTAPADVETARDLHVPVGTGLLHVELLYLAGDLPAVHVTYALSPEVSELIQDWGTFEPIHGIIEFLSHLFPSPLSHTSAHIAAVSADPAMAGTLGVAPGTALLRFISQGVAVTGTVLYRSVSYQSGELLEVHIHRPAQPLSPSVGTVEGQTHPDSD